MHFKDYKFTYANDIISKYSIDDNELIERYDCIPIRILNTVEMANYIYLDKKASTLRLIDLTFDDIPELVLVYGKDIGQSYSIRNISRYESQSLYEDNAFVEFHHYGNTLTGELLCTVTETDFKLYSPRRDITSQIISKPNSWQISKMIVSAIVHCESSVEYKINRDLIEIDISECETVTEEEYNKFMEDYYSSFEEITYPSVTKEIELSYWDDIAKENVEMTRDEVATAIDEAYDEYITLYEEFVK